MLPGGFAAGEWLVLVKAAVQSPIGERRILVGSGPSIWLARVSAFPIPPPFTGQAGTGPSAAIAVAPLALIAYAVAGGYRGKVFRILALFVLCAALVVPRTAWGAHLSGHEGLSASNSAHSHHDDHLHEHAVGGEAQGDLADPEDSRDGLTHDHQSASGVMAAATLPDALSFPIAALGTADLTSAERRAAPLSRPESLLRPPRTN